MDKEILFMIWLYDRELEELYNGNEYMSSCFSEARIKLCDIFGIDEKMQEEINE